MEEQTKQPFDLLPGVESRVIAGILSFMGILILVAWVAIKEEARMEEFTERFEGRSVEAGAAIFENNCSECHGINGHGITNAAPALNNPQLFGFNFFAEIDDEIAAKQAELETASMADDVQKAAQIEQEIAALEAQRLQLEETLLYDYQPELAALQTQLSNLDAQIVAALSESHGITSGSLFNVRVTTLNSQRESLNTQITDRQSELELVHTQIAAAEEAGEVPAPALLAQRDGIQTEIDIIQAQLDDVETQLEPFADFSQPRADLVAKIGRFNALATAHQEVLRLREEIDTKETELAALPAVPDDGQDPFAEQRTTLQTDIETLGDQQTDQIVQRTQARDALITNGDIVPYEPDRAPRTEELAWNGSLHDLIKSTLISGRPTSASYWPRPMAAWSQQAGGSLRDDQIENLVDFILNWDREFTIQDVRLIRQYAVIPGIGGAEEIGPPVGTDTDEILQALDILAATAETEDLETPVFDVDAGREAYNGATLGCSGCHVIGGAGAGPDPTGLATRAQEYVDAGNVPSVRYYLVQSIVQPGAFVVEGFSDAMPANFGTDRIDIETLSNIITYLETLD